DRGRAGARGFLERAVVDERRRSPTAVGDRRISLSVERAVVVEDGAVGKVETAVPDPSGRAVIVEPAAVQTRAEKEIEREVAVDEGRAGAGHSAATPCEGVGDGEVARAAQGTGVQRERFCA